VHIEIHQGHSPDHVPADIHVVLDVLRAFTTTHVAFERGIEEILMARTVEDAFALKRQHPDYLLAGERDARKVDGFDLGNSPAALSGRDLRGRRMILTTSNGVRATTHALDGTRVVVAGWTSAPATLDWIARHAGSDPHIALFASHPHSDEDVACAEYMRARLRGEDPPSEPFIERMRTSSSAQKFYSSAFELADLECATGDPFGRFVMRVDGDEPPVVRPSPSTPTDFTGR
jgi:2-phosphosulfolactate phosphatase